jgi:hypothetical protein
MTPKEKADELVEKFKKVELYHSMEPKDFDYQIKHISSASYTAKQCAIIAVDEIALKINGHHKDSELNTFIDYWQEVKQEIEKL